jgi:hypothetical protein
MAIRGEIKHYYRETPQGSGIPALRADQNSWSLADISFLISIPGV